MDTPINPVTLARLRSSMDAGYALNFSRSLSTLPNRHGYYKVVHEGGVEIYMRGVLVVAIAFCAVCGGESEVHFNDSPNGDPQCDDYAPCGRCADGMVIA